MNERIAAIAFIGALLAIGVVSLVAAVALIGSGSVSMGLVAIALTLLVAAAFVVGPRESLARMARWLGILGP